MAIYRFEAKIISRTGGRGVVSAAAYRTGKCATSAAAYRAGDKLTDERTGQRYDYTKKSGIAGAEIVLPTCAPSWMKDRAQLWNAVEKAEKRKDAQLARDFVISLPHELTQEQREALTREFVQEQFAANGYAADIAWHWPEKQGGLNHHAHVMVPMRKVEGDGFAKLKERPPEGKHPAAAWKEELARLRIEWANVANRHLAAAGLDLRIDHRSLVDRGIDREPEPKQGPLATQIERAGRESLAGNDRRAVKARNVERARLRGELEQTILEQKAAEQAQGQGAAAPTKAAKLEEKPREEKPAEKSQPAPSAPGEPSASKGGDNLRVLDGITGVVSTLGDFVIDFLAGSSSPPEKSGDMGAFVTDPQARKAQQLARLSAPSPLCVRRRISPTVCWLTCPRWAGST